MDLIQCPECGNMIDKNVSSCPNCGKSMSSFITYCPYCELLRKQKVLMNYIKENQTFICPVCAKTVGTMTTEQEKQVMQKRKAYEVKNINVTCQYCSSTNVTKISTTSKVVNTALFGFFGTKRHKQWHCNQCGSDF